MCYAARMPVQVCVMQVLMAVALAIDMRSGLLVARCSIMPGPWPPFNGAPMNLLCIICLVVWLHIISLAEHIAHGLNYRQLQCASLPMVGMLRACAPCITLCLRVLTCSVST